MTLLVGSCDPWNRLRNDLLCVEWDVKLYYTYTYPIAGWQCLHPSLGLVFTPRKSNHLWWIYGQKDFGISASVTLICDLSKMLQSNRRTVAEHFCLYLNKVGPTILREGQTLWSTVTRPKTVPPVGSNRERVTIVHLIELSTVSDILHRKVQQKVQLSQRDCAMLRVAKIFQSHSRSFKVIRNHTDEYSCV